MLHAPKHSRAPNGNAPQRSFADDVRGLPVSLRGFLENLHAESLVGYQLIQPDILFLKRLQLFHHLQLYPATLLTPTAISLFRDPNQIANFRNFLLLAELLIRSTQLGDNLVHTMTMTFLCHLKESFPGLKSERILSLLLDQV